MWQSGNMARPGDQIELDNKSYNLVASEKGEAILIRNVPEGIERRIEKSPTVELALRGMISLGRLRKKQMQAAQEKLTGKT